MFDKRTGRRDPARYEKIKSLVARRLRDRLGADACLQPSIVIVNANYESGEAKWDGVTRNVGGAGLLRTLLAVVPEGRMSVLSLEVDVAEPEGRLLYSRRGGLQPLRRLDDKSSPLDSAATRFGDDAIKTAALDRALGPWLERVRPNAEARADSLHL